MTAIRTIIYMGKDEEFHSELLSFTKNYLRTHFEIHALEYEKGILLKAGQDFEPNIIFIDQWTGDETLLEELTAIRSFKRTKSTLIVALCKDKEEADRLSLILTLGVSLIFIKGSDLEPFLKDCFYIGLDEKLGFPKYARAEGQNIEMTIGLLSTVTRMSNESFLVETDCEFKEGEPIRVKLPFLDFNPVLNCEVKKSSPLNFQYPMLLNYELLYPYAGPWDEVTEETIQPETIETWLSLHDPHFDQRQQIVRIYTDDLKFASECLLDSDASFLDFKEKIMPLKKEDLEFKRPSLFFIEINENNTLDDIHYLTMSFAKINEYNPIVVLLNASSSSEALRKIFNYSFIIASRDKLNYDVFQLLMDKFKTKKSSQEVFHHYFKKNDPNRLATLMLDVRITSITEHEVSFLTSIEIPAFSILRFDLPIPFFVTIIPPFYELFKRENYHHTMGIIHGLSEEDLKKLRKIVNQMIYRPVKELNESIIENMLKQDYAEVPPSSATPPLPVKVEKEEEEELAEAPDSAEMKRYKVKRKNYTGKCKL